MKLRFLGLLAALGLGSAAVLVYASNSRSSVTSLGACADEAGCPACPMAAKPVAAATDDCCAAESSATPATATVDPTTAQP